MVRKIGNLDAQELLKHRPAGQDAKKIGSSFYRGPNCNFSPYQGDFVRRHFLETYLLKGLAPSERPIKKTTKITAFGSCFASHIAEHLSVAGYNLSKDRDPNIYISSMGEGLVNVHAIAQQFEWALENVRPPEDLWHDYRAEEYGLDEAVRVKTERIFRETEFFIITLGLSEIWYDAETNGVFWRAVPMSRMDPSRHKFRVCSFDETKKAIARIYDIIGRNVPDAKVLFTLSPIPLAATFRPIGCIPANSASKAILRAALDEFYRENIADFTNRLFYFPSFEIVNELFFSRYIEDGRHVHPHILDFVMKLFEATYCDGSDRIADIHELFVSARRANAAHVAEPVSSGRRRWLRFASLFKRH